MWTMAVDEVSAEVIGALDAAGVGCLLLKGPTIAEWLYEDASERPYVDTDVLVDPDRLAAAHATLEAAGFRREWGPLPHPGMESPPSYPWHRGQFAVDLHETLPGAAADRRDVWAVLAEGSTEQRVGGVRARAPGRPALLVTIVLHAAHHGPRVERPRRDLELALDRAGDEDWAAAASVAERIGAAAAFATGLGIVPAGRALLARVGLDAPSSELRDVPLAAGIERLTLARGVRAKALLLRDELFPSREFMRWWTPMARGSWPGLVPAYVWRWLHLARRAPAALRASRRARAQPAPRAKGLD